MKYICVQPRTIYYYWQLDVMINNFLNHKIPAKNIEILVAYSQDPTNLTNSESNIELFNGLVKKYPKVKFYYYEDNRVNPSYISSVRPNILKQHFFKYKELSKETFLYHDCDIVFTRKPNFKKFLNDDIWYLSDTNSYINYDYVISKGEDIYNRMCTIVGLDKTIPVKNNLHSGGAQYLIKNVDYKFWSKVENDSERLYKEITFMNNEKINLDNSYHPLQIWCADMWAVLWNAWLFGNETKVDKYLDFCWPGNPISEWDNKVIFHNAGVTNDSEGLFYKGKYTKTIPSELKLEDFKKDTCSYNYVKELIGVKNK